MLRFTTIALSLSVITLVAVAEDSNLDSDRRLQADQVIFADSAAIEKKILSELAAKGPHYQPRTQLLLKKGIPKYTNRLILEDSPYLQQHAHNPVNWFAWSQEAFAKAEKEDKPIFLSIGYSTCHWCHVMEKQSYDNAEIADVLNRYFVSIKVDRERRPAVDATYMTAIQMTTGHGGWPLNSFLTPNGSVFYGGTYFPPGQFKTLLLRVHELWHSRRSDLEASAQKIMDALKKLNRGSKATAIVDKTTILNAVSTILHGHDTDFGGFGNQPKFPNEPLLFLLLEHALRSTDKAVLNVVTKTLDALGRGGIYDQIDGGFHRYATDRKWRIPHFEKMLYNQAQLSRIFIRAYSQTGYWFYRRIAEQTLEFTLREMQARKGGFYSAMDADSEEEEGLYYLWTPNQIRSVLSAKDATLAESVFGIDDKGDMNGKNILRIDIDLAEVANRKKLTLTELLTRLDEIRDKLRIQRARRVPPLTDHKILSAWNGMMITALCEAGTILDEKRYIDAAIGTAEFLWSNNRKFEGELNRIHLNGNSSIPGRQDDYVYFAEGLLCLYDATDSSHWLTKAEEMTNTLLDRFWDDRSGGFFMVDNKTSQLLRVRPKDKQDSAIPSANSVALRVLAMLAKRTANPIYQAKAKATLSALSTQIGKHPAAFAYMLTGLYEFFDGESGPRQFAARGALKLTGAAKNNDVTVQITLQPGWHINSVRPLQKDLIGTRMALEENTDNWKLAAVKYPQPKHQTLAFSNETLALYSGQIQLQSKILLKPKQPMILPLIIKLQACNEKSCLAPEDIHLKIPIVTPY